MNFLLKCLLYTIMKLAGPQRAKKLIPAMARGAGLYLLDVAYNNIGILKYENSMVSGEHYLVTKVLAKNLGKIERPIMFDVGANVGTYSLLLSKVFPQAKIYAFEPNENTFKQLVVNVDSSVKCVNAGMGSEEKNAKIFTFADDLTSTNASIYGEMFRSYKKDDLVEIEIQLTTLDLFCEHEGIKEIDFLKIDTEGNEHNVLRGANKMLTEGKVKIIQFEFGEYNVFSRVFLRDFYEILTDYNIYRLDSERLIPLFEYNLLNEIFRFQNLLAIRMDFPFDDGQ
jgi:FkbM family methyltransferase